MYQKLQAYEMNLLVNLCVYQNLDSQGIYKWFSYAKSIIDETGLDILQLQNTTSSNQVKLTKKYAKFKLLNLKLSF
jgi:hypothetical protein